MDYEAARKDKQKVEACISKGMEYVEKALAVDPEKSDVLYYKGLFYREKQKMTKNEAERKKFADEAEAIAKKATEITKRKEAEAAAAKEAKEAKEAEQQDLVSTNETRRKQPVGLRWLLFWHVVPPVSAVLEQSALMASTSLL